MKQLKQILIDFFKTQLGKRVGIAALAIIVVDITIGAIIITNSQNNDKKEEPTTIAVVQNKVEETTEKETETETETETTTEEPTTVEEETTEEETTIAIIPIEELDVSMSDEVGEDAQEVERDNAVIIEEVVEEETTGATTNNTITAPPVASNEYACVVNGIDVSDWQGDIDWAQVKAAGYDFAIIRCGYRGYGYGRLAIDSKFEQNIQGALANGVQVGVYFFSQAITVQEAQEEASLVISLLKDYKITYPVVFDWETANNPSDPWRTNINLSVDTMTSIADTYLTMMEQAGYKGMLYGNRYDLKRFNWEYLSQKYKVWLAGYPNRYQNYDTYYKVGDELPELYCGYQMWQYKSTGQVPGINARVDMNVAFFSYTGSNVPNSPLKITVTNPNFVTNQGTAVNLLTGVTAKSTAGTDITSSITYEVINASGVAVTADAAFKTPGKYTVIYHVKDFTGVAIEAEATLVVRSKPVLTVNYVPLTWFDTTDAVDVSDNEMALAVEAKLQEILKANIVTAKDYEGNNLISKVVIEQPKPLYLMNGLGTTLANKTDLTDALLKQGTYVFTYKLTDSKGLSVSTDATMNIVGLVSDRVEIELSDILGDGSEDVSGETSGETTSTSVIDVSVIKEMLNARMRENITKSNVEGVEIILDETLVADLQAGEVTAGKEYQIKYTMDNLDEAKYYKICTLVIIDSSADDSTGESDSSQETESSSGTASSNVTGALGEIGTSVQ